jgi:hypothetical protein
MRASLRETVDALLADGDVNGAWRLARSALVEDPLRALEAVARVASLKWHDPLPGFACAALADPTHASLFGLGHALVTLGEYDAASAVLRCALAGHPEDGQLILELVSARELAGDHDGAYAVLLQSPPSVTSRPLVQFLLGFHAVLAGVPTPAIHISGEDETALHLRRRWARMQARAALFPPVDPASRLLVASGCFALRVSRQALSERQAGSALPWNEAAGVIQALRGGIADVMWLEASDSARVAGGLATCLGARAHPFDGSPGLLVVHDLADVLPERAEQLRNREDVVLYAHRASAVREFPVAPDVLGIYAPASEAPEEDPFAEPPNETDTVHAQPLTATPMALGRWCAAGPIAGPCSTPRERLWAGLL